MKQPTKEVKIGIICVSIFLAVIFVYSMIRSKKDIETTETTIRPETKETHKIQPDSAVSRQVPDDLMDRYHQWFERNKNLLATMTNREISAAIKQKREELFGKEMATLPDMESQEDHYRNLLAVFNKATHISLNKKLDVFKQAWLAMPSGSYLKTPGAKIPERIHECHLAFLDMDSVQIELQQLPAAERASVLAAVRRAMGYDETKIAEMAKFDAFKEEQWLKGKAYLSERDKIIKAFNGSEKENRLRALRHSYWGREANIIAAEEAAHFFRFKQRRVYGHN